VDEIRRYLDSAHPEPDALLLELEQHGRKEGIPVVSRETGRFLSAVVTAMQASRILEVGTALGYSTLWMARAQPRMGKIWTIEADVRRTDIARSYFRRAGEDDYIEVFNTPALQLLDNFPHRNLDLAVVATDKGEYRHYLDLVLPMLKLSGLVIFDDCLLGGRVAQPPRSQDDATLRAMRDFNARFLTHPALDATILPLGGGTGIGARRQ
jgi:predicted O-methyltransferase YrrM